MEPARILLTGAAGFVGRHLLATLRRAFPGAEIAGSGLGDAGSGLLPLDVTDAAGVAALVGDFKPDACIHLAAIAAIPAAGSDPDQAWRVNLLGTLGLARAVLAHAPGCRFVFASSAEVYGRSFRSGQALDETALLAPANTYAATKAAADLALGALATQDLQAVRLRPFNHTGAGQSASFVVAAFARQVARIEAGLQPPVLRVGALEPRRDFLDVQDVCDAYVAALRAPTLEAGIVFNIASGTPRRVGDVLDALCRVAGVEARVETGTALLRPSEIPTASGSAARAQSLLAWRPRTPWEATLRTVLDDWRQRVRDEPPASPGA